MSGLRQLVSSGGECGAGANPLVKLSTQYKSRERTAASLQLGSRGGRIEEEEDGAAAAALVSDFLSEAAGAPPSFRMDHLLPIREDVGHSHGIIPPSRNKSAALDWSKEFLLLESSSSSEQPLAPLVERRQGLSNKWAEEYLGEEIPVLDEGADRMAEIARDIADSGDVGTSRFFNFMRRVGTGEARLIGGRFVPSHDGEIECECHECQKELDDAWIEANPPRELEAEEYKQDFWNTLENEWKTQDHEWLSEFSDNYEPFKEYQFKDENPLRDVTDPLQEGKERLAQGDIPSAVLLFESAVQKNGDSAEAWSLLGRTQAQNEQDPSAIAALKRAIDLDPRDATALMALAVSYTNESYQAQACHLLQDWIHRSDSYSHLNPTPASAEAAATKEKFQPPSSFMSREQHEETLSMFLSAARSNPSSEIDADVQCGLGILFNLSGDYEKAADCFRSALQVRPDDALLWNKLGATLANGDRSEEAVSAYHSALKHSPGFVRSRYNLGISCINLKAYQEAAEHFLSALSFQAAGRGPEAGHKSVMSDSIWSSLRLCVSLLNRKELYPSINDRNLQELNRAFRVEGKS